MIAKRIKLLRERKGFTQKQLAEILNLSQQAIAKWETGKSEPDVKMINKLAELFEVDVSYLIGNTNFINFAKEKSPSAETERDELINDLVIKLQSEEDINIIMAVSDYSDYVIQRRKREKK